MRHLEPGRGAGHLPGNVVIGDTVIDEVQDDNGNIRRFCGGSALNVATALRRLGRPVDLITAFGMDEDGHRIRSFLSDEGVALHVAPGKLPTRVARARQVADEPGYTFSDTRLRHVHIGAAEADSVAGAASVVISAPSISDPAQATLLRDTVRTCPGLRAIDPNPRADLITDIALFRRHFERVAGACTLVKMSVADAQTLYQDDGDAVAAHILRLGTRAVVLTLGERGSTAYTAEGTVHHPGLAIDVADTIGAGDATLAALVAALGRDGWPADRTGWREVLGFGMAVAALTCTGSGGAAATPTIAQVELLRSGLQQS